MKLGVYLQKKDERSWEKHLEEEGVLIQKLTVWPENKKEKEWILLTDDVKWVRRAAEEKLPVIYYQVPGAPNEYGGDMTILTLSDLDMAFLEQVCKRHYGLPWTIVQTERLCIRESTPEDFEALYALYGGKETVRFLEGPEEKEKEREKLFCYIKNQYPFYGYGLYTVIEKETQEIVGRAGYENREVDDRICVEIGYLIREDKRNRGYATEVVLALIEVLADYTGEEKAVIVCHENNTASRKVAEKVRKIYPDRVQICFSS